MSDDYTDPAQNEFIPKPEGETPEAKPKDESLDPDLNPFIVGSTAGHEPSIRELLQGHAVISIDDFTISVWEGSGKIDLIHPEGGTIENVSIDLLEKNRHDLGSLFN